MTSFSKKILILALTSSVFGGASALAADFVCRLTLARAGEARMATKGVIHMRGNIGERIAGTDEGTDFRYKIEVSDGEKFACRGNRRQVSVTLSRRGDNRGFITGSTCFEPNRDFLVHSSADNHWIYFQCYSESQRLNQR